MHHQRLLRDLGLLPVNKVTAAVVCSVGHERQHLNLVTYALVVNSVALHRHRQRTTDPPVTAAA